MWQPEMLDGSETLVRYYLLGSEWRVRSRGRGSIPASCQQEASCVARPLTDELGVKGHWGSLQKTNLLDCPILASSDPE